MSGKFHNQVAVVTGASTGIGFAMARGLIAEGAKRVYITGRSAGTLEAAVAELGDKAVAVLSDVSQQADLDKLKATIEARRRSVGRGVCQRGHLREKSTGRNHRSRLLQPCSTST